MDHILKNIAIRVWIAFAAGGLASLGLLAVLGSPLDPSVSLVVAAVLTVLAFLGSGWMLNRIASLRLQDYLREATSLERTARTGEAAEAFRKATLVFDSFMVSPLARRRLGRELAGRIARFHIARAVRSTEADAFITSYLGSYPDDAEVAEHWLQNTRLGAGADPDNLALADRIAAAQPENLTIHSLIADTYLAKRRTDYTALQTYKRLLQESNHSQGPAISRLADLFLQEGRSDEWALEVYLKAYTQDPARTDCLKGLAACQEQIRESERNEPLLTASREVLRKVDRDTIRQWQASFQQGTLPPSAPEPARANSLQVFASMLVRGFLHGFPRAAAASYSLVSSWLGAIGNYWRESQRARQVARWAAVIVFAAVVVVSGIRTVIYILETKEPPEAPSTSDQAEPQMATSGRYTVQVASFRNQPQAIDLAKRIQQQGYPAYWGESRSSEEDVWYYVRISRFEDKQDAKKFAEELKSKRIIDDFYIANYKEP
jgi:hypothetical protein